MDSTKVKFKVGVHEFEAEGPAEVVKAQLEAFREMIAMVPATVAVPAAPVTQQPPTAAPTLAPTTEMPDSGGSAALPDAIGIDRSLSKIAKLDGRVVSLTVRADPLPDAILLLIYGQKIFRNNDAVTGTEIMSGLTATGQRVERVDRILTNMGDRGDVIVIGVGRSKTYRLTNMGMDNARKIAARLIATVA